MHPSFHFGQVSSKNLLWSRRFSLMFLREREQRESRSREAVNSSRENIKKPKSSGTRVTKISDAFPETKKIRTELKYSNQTETTSMKIIVLLHPQVFTNTPLSSQNLSQSLTQLEFAPCIRRKRFFLLYSKYFGRFKFQTLKNFGRFFRTLFCAKIRIVQNVLRVMK